jgi:hypothetical protein
MPPGRNHTVQVVARDSLGATASAFRFSLRVNNATLALATSALTTLEASLPPLVSTLSADDHTRQVFSVYSASAAARSGNSTEVTQLRSQVLRVLDKLMTDRAEVQPALAVTVLETVASVTSDTAAITQRQQERALNIIGK